MNLCYCRVSPILLNNTLLTDDEIDGEPQELLEVNSSIDSMYSHVVSSQFDMPVTVNASCSPDNASLYGLQVAVYETTEVSGDDTDFPRLSLNLIVSIDNGSHQTKSLISSFKFLRTATLLRRAATKSC